MKSKNLGMGKMKQLEDKLVGDAVRRCPVSAFYRLFCSANFAFNAWGGRVILTAAQCHKNNNSTEISNDVRYKTLQLKITHKIKIIKAKEKQHNTYYYVYVLYILPWYRFLLIR